MSGGGGNTTVQQSGPPEWAIPYVKDYYNRAQATSDLPYLPYTGQRNADLNAYQTAGLDAQANRAMQGAQEVGQARQQLGNTLGGAYLGQGNYANPYAGSNPYLDQTINKSLGDVTRAYQNTVRPGQIAANAASGSFGNAGLQEQQANQERQLAETLGNVSSGMRFQDYGLQGQYGENAANRATQGFQNERNRQVQGIGMATGLANQDYIDASALQNAGGVYQGQEQLNRNTDYQNFLEARGYPTQQLQTLGSAFGVSPGDTRTATEKQKSNPLGSVLGIASAAMGLK